VQLANVSQLLVARLGPLTIFWDEPFNTAGKGDLPYHQCWETKELTFINRVHTDNDYHCCGSQTVSEGSQPAVNHDWNYFWNWTWKQILIGWDDVVGGVNFSSAVDWTTVYDVTVVLLIFYLVYFFGFHINVCLQTTWFLEAVWSSEPDTHHQQKQQKNIKRWYRSAAH